MQSFINGLTSLLAVVVMGKAPAVRSEANTKSQSTLSLEVQTLLFITMTPHCMLRSAYLRNFLEEQHYNISETLFRCFEVVIPLSIIVIV